MTQLRPLIITAILANLLTICLYNYAAGQPGGSGVALLFALVWMPVLWLITIIATIIVSIIKRKYLFQKPIVRWTLVTLLFTTPIPAIAFYYLTHPTPETRNNAMETNTINGKVYKTEFWERTSTHVKFADKRFIADSAQEAMYGDKAFKKDSFWVYFDSNGDTLKLEYYKNDSLIETKQLKSK
ncbi:MAG TPA: hypothetical protein VNG53_07205 [Bacteroidia bacterium]|nr:hypothetical protein [Bacteroidia bacterium]